MGNASLYTSEKTAPKNDLAYSAPAPDNPNLPNDTYLTLAIALMASSFSFSGCLRPLKTEKAPVLTFVGGTSAFLFREVTIKNEYENKSKKLLEIKKWKDQKDADNQINAYEKSAAQESLSAQAAEKKASNARFLKKVLYISAGLFATFPLIQCKGCVTGYLGCLPKYSSCSDMDFCTASIDANPFLKNLFNIFSIPSAYALGLNAKKLGITSLGLILGKANILGERLSSIPDIGKSAMLQALSKAADNAAKTWEKAAKHYRKNEQSYKHLAGAIKAALDTPNKIDLNKKITPPKYASNPFNREKDRKKNSSSNVSPCAVGNLGELTIDKNCQCKKTGTCTTVSLPTVNFSALNTPEGLSDAYDSLGSKMNKSFQGNYSPSGDIATDLSRTHASGIGDWPQHLFDKIKKDIDGRQPGEFDNLQSSALKKLNKAVGKFYKSMSPQDKTAFHHSTGLFPSEIDSNVSPLPLTTPTSNTTVITSPSLPQTSSSPKALHSFFEDNSNPSPSPDKEQSFENFSIPDSTIIQQAKNSLWKIITLRYFITAYPRLFEEKR